MKELFKKLIGAQIVKLTEDQIIVRTSEDDDPISLDFYKDNIDCGWASIRHELFYEEGNKENPVITNIEVEENENGCSERVVLTLFGEAKTLAEYNFSCGSDSGWHYGAAITVVCGLNEKTVCKW